MKAIGIVGSPRRDGNTVYLTRQVLDALKEKFETELIFLKDLDLNPCDGCHSCAKTSKCIIKDDMQLIFNKLKKSKVILLSSPVYMGGTTSRLRIFMERTWHLRKGQLKDKIGSYIVIGRRDLGVAVNEIEEFIVGQAVKRPRFRGMGTGKYMVETDDEDMQKDLKGRIQSKDRQDMTVSRGASSFLSSASSALGSSGAITVRSDRKTASFGIGLKQDELEYIYAKLMNVMTQ